MKPLLSFLLATVALFGSLATAPKPKAPTPEATVIPERIFIKPTAEIRFKPPVLIDNGRSWKFTLVFPNGETRDFVFPVQNRP